jgi:predicted dehydrogenase
MNQKLRIAVVGCGQIADAHLGAISRNVRAELVAVCDRYQDLAYQAAARFAVPRQFTDLLDLLTAASPDVVHITTPPASHVPLALECLRRGAHVYIEKPFALAAREGAELFHTAQACGRLVCVGHDQQFEPAWREATSIVANGAIGDVVHVEAVQGYDLAGPFGAALARDPQHWVHKLPGGLFHNVISHCVARLAQYLPEPQSVLAEWFDTRGTGFPTDLRAMLRGNGVTASLFFSSQAKPVQKLMRVYGSKGVLEVDLDARLVRRYAPLTWPGPFAKIQAGVIDFREGSRNLRAQSVRLLKRKLHYFASMDAVFEEFYRAIQHGGEPPISYDDALRTAAMMDAIFDECRKSSGRPAGVETPLMGLAV